jgi:hypothetical protein
LIEAQGVFHYADSLRGAGQYSLAAVEYERVIFEHPSPSVTAEAGMKRAACLKMENRYAAAATTLDAINTAGLSDSLRQDILFRSALNSYLAHEPAAAFSKLERLSYFYPGSAQKHDVLMMKILSLNELKQWQKADTLYRRFMLAFASDPVSYPDPYQQIPRLKDPEKAQRLAAYLPFTGAGFFYAGKVGEGLLNIGLQTGLIAFAVYSGLTAHYITGVLIGVGGYASFYKGGTRRVKWLVERSNERKTLDFNTRVRTLLLQTPK